MSVEARVELLETHFDSLDSAVRSLIKITGKTHQEILATRLEMRTRFSQQDSEMAELKQHMNKHDKRFDQLELLIRQLLPNANN